MVEVYIVRIAHRFALSMGRMGVNRKSSNDTHRETLNQIASPDQFLHYSWQLFCFRDIKLLAHRSGNKANIWFGSLLEFFLRIKPAIHYASIQGATAPTPKKELCCAKLPWCGISTRQCQPHQAMHNSLVLWPSLCACVFCHKAEIPLIPLPRSPFLMGLSPPLHPAWPEYKPMQFVTGFYSSVLATSLF